MQLNALIAEPEDRATRPPLLIAHGLFGSARNWNTLARRLAQGRRVAAVDMRNHGDSPRAPTQTYQDMAQDLADSIETLGAPADVLGHSMGGKAAMALALLRPELVRRLVVADIAPVRYGHSHAHYIEAMRAVDLSRVRRRAEADAQLAERLEDRAMRAFLLQSLAAGPDGARWKLNLEALERALPDIMDWPEALDARRFDGPALFVSGERSDYVTEAGRARIRALFPQARFAAIPGAGHWLHAEKPQEFLDEVAAFLAA
ncbi:alpha/beta fold hydrolase [Oceanicella actignis]|uniref:alpha/beta fold hydrolase n=1 Tax=Oceanicella actignis TaxID=1189325 RepID=UPI0011E6583D|nr:alpha/beta fold hydrolase [Oceanicella actignis]TYO88203.1 pimeloyl-ACP methyl ester carboxylesterase [Oceanicella actignis]